jgi:hypothetical protein
VISRASYSEGNYLQNVNFLHSIPTYFYQVKHWLILGKKHSIYVFKENNNLRGILGVYGGYGNIKEMG